MKTVLILGATGLFGGHLARQLITEGRFDVVCAGRTEASLKAFTKAHGGHYLAFNRNAPEAALAKANPFAVVDAAGPSLVSTPDALLAAHFHASAVLPRAGLELGLFHHALRLARFLPFPLGHLTKPAHHIAGWFQAFGSDLGGMRVRATGGGLTKTWDIIAPDGHGPKIPVQPAAILLGNLANSQTTTGARPCIAEIPLADLEAAMALFGAQTETRITKN